MKKDELIEEIKIDPTQLDVEWTNHAELFLDHALTLEDLKLELEECSLELNAVKASLDKEIRTNPQTFGIMKITEKSIASVISVDARVVELESEISKINHRVGIQTQMVRAFEHRKKALEKLVDLHGQQYFAQPHTSDENQQVAKKSIQKTEMKRRRRRAGKKT